MMPTTYHSNSYYNRAQLEVVENTAKEFLPQILSHFGLELSNSHNRYYGSCPIHGGDKYNAFNIDKQSPKTGHWKCYTRQCHKIFHGGIIGLVRGLISRYKYKWSGPNDEDRICPFTEAVNFLVKFTNCESIDEVKDNYIDIERNNFINNIAPIYTESKNVDSIRLTKKQVRNELLIPSPYYLSKDYSSEILNKYDIGDCVNPYKPMYKRCVAPIYDNNHEFCIGCTGRSIFEQCPLCESWHNPAHDCPDMEKRKRYCKWKHNYGFVGEHHLYNFWFAKEHIMEHKVAILTESVGNILRLEQAGIHIGLGTFGAHLTNLQKDILDKSGAMALIVLSDPDQAGKVMNRLIEESCKNTYQLHFPNISPVDIGDTSVSLLQNKLFPIIESVRNGL